MAPSSKADQKRSKKEKQRLHQEVDENAVSRSRDDTKRQKKKQKLHSPAAAPSSPSPEKNVKVSSKQDKPTESINKKKQQRKQRDFDNGARDSEGNEALITDPRFTSAHSDPRFQSMPRQESKVTIDSRFSRILTDDSFNASSAPVDKRGKPKKGKKANPMLDYYLLQQKNDEDEVDGKSRIKVDDTSSDSEGKASVEEDFSNPESDSDVGSTDDDDDDDEGSVGSEITGYLMANHKDIPTIEQETHRLAVVNMDWEHIKAVDLYVVMNSCLPKGGEILSVTIYPSEFGLKCMEVEAVHGPSALFEDDEDDSEDDSEIDDDKLRTYELNKLRYYFAVVVCDSSATANYVYRTLDGTELLKTSNIFDLRFIPDSMEFTHASHDIATEAPTSYKEPDFQTRALQHSKVKLTWEDDEPSRVKTLRRKFNPDQLDDFKEYLASTESDDDDDENEIESDAGEGDDVGPNGRKKRLDREKLLSLLQPEDDSDAGHSDGKDMEVTFNTGLEDLSKRILEKKDKQQETVWESVLRKRKEKKMARKRRSKNSSEDDSSDYDDAREAPDQPDDFFVESDTEPIGINKEKSKTRGKSNRKGRDRSPEANNETEATRAELDLLVADDDGGGDHGPKGYNLKPKKLKDRKGKVTPDENTVPSVDYTEDPRFAALLGSHNFALDPTDPQFKRSAAYARQRSGKQEMDDNGEEETVQVKDVGFSSLEKERHEFSSTVRSLKRNLVNFKGKRKP